MFILASFILCFQTKIYTSFHDVTALPAGHCSLSKRHRVKERERDSGCMVKQLTAVSVCDLCHRTDLKHLDATEAHRLRRFVQERLDLKIEKINTGCAVKSVSQCCSVHSSVLNTHTFFYLSYAETSTRQAFCIVLAILL